MTTTTIVMPTTTTKIIKERWGTATIMNRPAKQAKDITAQHEAAAGMHRDTHVYIYRAIYV